MAITFGASSPSQVTTNLDALFATSLANYSKKLEDNISESNALFYEMKKNGSWEKEAGGTYLAVDLMYELGQFDSYDGYDELPDTPTDGITQAIYEWRQGAVPISYSEKERKQNKQRLHNLVKAKIMQAEMGFIEGFNKAILQGSMSQGGASLVTPYQSAVNGSYFIDPLPKIIDYVPSGARSVGNIAQNTYTWWRNRTKTSAATTYLGFLLEFENMYNTCARGPGGPPNLIITDQTSYELLNAAYYQKYQTQQKTDGNYPFENVMFRKAHVIYDQYVSDVESTLTSTATYGTAYFVNTKFLKMRVESETNFEMEPFVKPPKGDSRLAHILFMGQLCTSNRRKLGVMGKIARTLTA